MKYCKKCYKEIQSDMMFCPNCGCEISESNDNLNSIIEQISKIKEYNLIIPSSNLSWEYISQNGKEAIELSAQQNKMCLELCDLVKNVLQENSDNSVEEDLYNYILNVSFNLCREGTLLFNNYNGYDTFFKNGDLLVRSGRLNPSEFLDDLLNIDYPYKLMAGNQSLNAIELRKVLLNNDLIQKNKELLALNKLLAQEFNNMFLACIQRYIKFFTSPSQDFIDTNWKMYEEILKGLPQAIIDTLDESCWNLALNDLEKNHNGKIFKIEFNKMRDKRKTERLNSECNKKEKKYWDSHPNEYKLFEEKQNQKNSLEQQLNDISGNLISDKEKKETFENNISNLEKQIKSIDIKIFMLKKTLFSKEKAKQKIILLQSSISEKNKQISEEKEKVLQCSNNIKINNRKYLELENKISKVNMEILKLKTNII